jgi:putative mRNA 3-end processing factor
VELRFLGGAREVGRSALLVNGALLIDYGIKSGAPPAYPLDCDPEAVVVSHGHLDHVGAVPALCSATDRPPVHMTPPTYELGMELARDTLDLHGGTPHCRFTGENVRRLTAAATTHGYGEPFDAAGHEVTLFDAGHIPGSAHVLVDDGDTRLLYTGDFNTTDQRLVAGTTARPEADVVVTESTYATETHPDRQALERSFAESVRTTLWEGGTVVVPAFAIGRTQEVLLICERADVTPYVDGMGVRVTETLRRHPGYVRDPDALQRAKSNARTVSSGGQRERIADSNEAVVTTAGMLSGGPAVTYVGAIRRDPVNTVCLTGYQVAGTPGRELLDTGRCELDGVVRPVAAQVELYDFSAHADREGLLAFLNAYRGARILPVHGDDTPRFADTLREGGFDATAPELGATVTV